MTRLTQPFSHMIALGLTELIGINEQVDQNDYSASVEVELQYPASGEILSFAFYSTEDGSGAVQSPAGWLYLFAATPAISSGDTAMTAAARITCLGRVEVAAGDWETDANGGMAYIYDTPIPFHYTSSLFFAFKLTSATAMNSAAGDDEQLEFNAWYRRDG